MPFLNPMPEPILMPSLSPTMTQGYLVKWHKSEGDPIKPGDILMDIETDKAVMEVEATQEGILDYIAIEASQNSVQVGQILAVMRQAQEEVKSGKLWYETQVASAPPASQAKSVIQEECPQGTAAPSSFATSKSPCDNKAHAESNVERILASPLARKVAELTGKDLSKIQGSGPGGRILKRDVEEHLMESVAAPIVQRIPLSGMRKTIAERLCLSKQTIPHFSVSALCHMDALMQLRQKMNQPEKVFSVNDFVVRGCALALAQYPIMRTLWADDHLVQYPSADLAVAVSIPGGLVTPVIYQADTKTLRSLKHELQDLVVRARANKLKPNEYSGGVFTLSNLGMWDVEAFQAIINPPHVGIMAVASIQKKSIVQGDQIVIGHMMHVSVSADHRVVDGQQVAEFLSYFKTLMENPYQLLS